MIQVKHDHTVFDLILTLFPERVLAIEKIINSKMTEFELEEEKIIKILARFKIFISQISNDNLMR